DDDCGTVPIADVVLYDHCRAAFALFGPAHRVQIDGEDVTTPDRLGHHLPPHRRYIRLFRRAMTRRRSRPKVPSDRHLLPRVPDIRRPVARVAPSAVSMRG